MITASTARQGRIVFINSCKNFLTNRIIQIQIYLCPLFPLDLVEEELVVDEGLLAVVELSAKHDELAVLCNC